jgi:hypothetical protein
MDWVTRKISNNFTKIVDPRNKKENAGFLAESSTLKRSVGTDKLETWQIFYILL